MACCRKPLSEKKPPKAEEARPKIRVYIPVEERKEIVRDARTLNPRIRSKAFIRGNQPRAREGRVSS